MDNSRVKIDGGYVKWNRLPGGLTVDPNEDVRYKLHARLNWNSIYGNVAADSIKSPEKYFELSYPMRYLNRIVEQSKQRCQRLGNNIEKAIMDSFCRKNVFQRIGIRMSMILESRHGSISDYWVETPIKGRVGRPAQFGSRFGISRNVFLCWEKFTVYNNYTGAVNEVICENISQDIISYVSACVFC